MISVALPAVPAGTEAVVCVADERAGVMTTLEDVTGVRLPLEKAIEIVDAVGWLRPEKETRPLTATTDSVPESVPVPAARAAVTMVELSDVTRLLFASVISTAG